MTSTGRKKIAAPSPPLTAGRPERKPAHQGANDCSPAWRNESRGKAASSRSARVNGKWPRLFHKMKGEAKPFKKAMQVRFARQHDRPADRSQNRAVERLFEIKKFRQRVRFVNRP